MDGYSSENTSRAQTPLNTPDGTSSKLGQELDGDHTKPVYRRLKIISENSLDSALSDASKASDGKEEEDDEEEEEEEESKAKADPGGEAAYPGGEVGDPRGEAADSGGEAGESGVEAVVPGGDVRDTGGEAADPGCEAGDTRGEATDLGGKAADLEDDAADPGGETADPNKGAVEEQGKEGEWNDPEVNSDAQKEEDKIKMGLEENTEADEVSTETHSDEQEMPEVDSKEQESVDELLDQTVSEMTDLEGNKPDIVPESQPMQVEAVDVPPLNNEIEATKQEEQADKAASGSEDQPGESSVDPTLISEPPEVCAHSEVSQATPVEPSVTGTPSQDEEEGVSDVESERSQEPQLSALDISTLASRLLESWKDLKVKSD